MKRHFTQLLALLLWAGSGPAFAETVRLHFDASNPQARYAAEKLTSTLRDHKHEIARKRGKSDFVVTLSLDPNLKPEGFSTAVGSRSKTISGGDGRGVVYGALSVVEQLRNGTALRQIGGGRESQFAGRNLLQNAAAVLRA